MVGEELSQILRRGGRAYGTLIVSTSPKWPEALINSGLDFVFIDTEHIPLDRQTLSWMCKIYDASGFPAIVRIPSANPAEACQVLDGGAYGIVAPYVETVVQVRELVGAVKLRPLKGKLLEAALHNPDILAPQVKDYLAGYNAGNLVVINIESVPAVENLDAMISVPGLDAVLIGPHDLSVSMGIPEQYHHPNFDRVVRAIIHQVRDRNLTVGIHFWEGWEQELEWAKAGANLIVHSGDIRLFADRLRGDIAKMRQSLGDEKLLADNAIPEAERKRDLSI